MVGGKLMLFQYFIDKLKMNHYDRCLSNKIVWVHLIGSGYILKVC